MYTLWNFLRLMLDADAGDGGNAADTAGSGAPAAEGTGDTISEPPGTTPAGTDAETPGTVPPESGAEPGRDAPKLKVKYNKQERELSPDEAVEYAQKGMNYDKIYGELQNLKSAPWLEAAREAAERGVDVADLLKAAPERELTAEISELRASGYDEAQAREIAEGRIAKRQLERERGRQAAEQKRRDRIQADLAEFRELYPDIDPEKVPAEVWAQVQGGKALTDAYMRYDLRRQRAQGKAQEVNDKNRQAASPAPKSDGGTEKGYYTREQVKAMSASEVSAHYDAILQSMPKWPKK